MKTINTENFGLTLSDMDGIKKVNRISIEKGYLLKPKNSKPYPNEKKKELITFHLDNGHKWIFET